MLRVPLTFASAKALIAHLPGIEEGTSYGTAALKVRRQLIARLREDGETLVVLCGFDERDLRMQARPDVFFNLPHYCGYPTVLIHLPKVSASELREVLEVAWRRVATAKLLAEWKAATPESRPGPLRSPASPTRKSAARKSPIAKLSNAPRRRRD